MLVYDITNPKVSEGEKMNMREGERERGERGASVRSDAQASPLFE